MSHLCEENKYVSLFIDSLEMPEDEEREPERLLEDFCPINIAYETAHKYHNVYVEILDEYEERRIDSFAIH